MSSISDAVFFIVNKQLVKQMLFSEFEALLDGVVEAPEFKNEQISAVFIQIDAQLKIRGLVCFYLPFTAQGFVEKDWNIPLQQLLQSASTGPDLGAGKIRLVCRSQCSVPWHQNNLWDPTAEHLKLLIKTVENNSLALDATSVTSDIRSDMPTFGRSHESISEAPLSASEPPLLGVKIPTLDKTQVIPTLTTKPVGKKAESDDDLAAVHALKAAYAIKMDKLQKSYDELSDSHQSTISSLKKQAKQQLTVIEQDFQVDIDKREQQIATLNQRLQLEQSRYHELKEHQAESAADSQFEREQLLSKLQDNEDIGSEKIIQLQQAFKKELDSRLEAEITKVNDALAMREVELFYRDEQLALLRDDIQKVKVAKQIALSDSGHQVLSALEDDGVTLVAFHDGVGHITIASEDVGRYLEQKTAYLAERCKVSIDIFNAWQAHYKLSVCMHEENGQRCKQAVPRVDLIASFELGLSDRCTQHIK